ncbi:Regulator of nonsense transcripts [Plasmodium coatneyi]|uniref:Regulator of nonsense transcripts n=1 Tax=Plasmodium coatneyi TaxID=208452 RepID=A0A1B1DYI7_9APIC|nr:Regulator of nonsense transcripts [Plasmodium coatneyi]ANQ07834.1 Regulator of nonsense transcripts [Plasmodium coatneyi]
MDSTFDYNQIDVDDFDDFYNFCTLKEKEKKKNGKNIGEQFFQTDVKNGENRAGDEDGEESTDNSSVDTTSMYKEGNEKNRSTGKNSKPVLRACNTSHEKRLDEVQTEEENRFMERRVLDLEHRYAYVDDGYYDTGGKIEMEDESLAEESIANYNKDDQWNNMEYKKKKKKNEQRDGKNMGFNNPHSSNNCNVHSLQERSSYGDHTSNRYVSISKEDYERDKKKMYEDYNGRRKYPRDYSQYSNSNCDSYSYSVDMTCVSKGNKEEPKYFRCRYCEMDSVDSVVQCNTCGRWFCNGSYGTCGSHIVTHLVRSKHKEIKLHKKSLLGETILECYNCGCKNVFLLGFLPTPEEGVVVIICRDPCLARCISLSGKGQAKGEMEQEELKQIDEKGNPTEVKNTPEGEPKKGKKKTVPYEDFHAEEELIGTDEDDVVSTKEDMDMVKSKGYLSSDDLGTMSEQEKGSDGGGSSLGVLTGKEKNQRGEERKTEKDVNQKENESDAGSSYSTNVGNNVKELVKMKDWDLNKWQPVIEDRCLLEWLVNIPTAEEAERKGKRTTSYNVNKLEELWKNKKDVYIDELDAEILNDEPVKVELRYKDAYHYQSIFAPLIQLEADYDKSIKEGQKQANVTVRWDIGLNKKRYAHFIYVKEESELRLVAGDELKLSYTYPDGTVWTCEGHISRIHNTEEIALELRTSGTASGPWVDNITTGYTVEFVWKSTAYDRMQLALNEFAQDSYSLSGYLYHKLLGHEVSEESLNYYKTALTNQVHGKRTPRIANYSAPNLAALNHSQIDAIKKSLVSPLSLIQGPPGTGKTLTCATLVYHLSKTKMGKVLVTAPSNVAVDQLSVRIHKTGLKVVRLCAKSREYVPSIADYLYLHNQMKLLKSDIGEELNKLLELKEEVGELSQKDERRLKKLIFFAEYKILVEADVICTTCVGAMDKRLKRFRFSQVLVDEATQSTEPECLVPLVTGAKQIVLVGDHCQLGPIIVCKKAANAGLGKSLFERLVMLGITPFRLEVQYRMHPALSEFPSYVFYDGCLQNGITLKEREYPLKDFPWPNPKCPMFFYNSTGLEEMSASGTSYLNRAEASNMEKLVRTLINCGLKPSQIGVITPYEGQRAYITSLFQKNISYQHSTEIEVASVDAFQGREKDFILLSCVRSNKKLGIGFLNDPRRLNVALTRAKYGLIICGNAKVLSRHHVIVRKSHNSNETITNVNSVWINLLSQFKKKDLIVEGCLSNLKPMNIHIPTPTKQPSRYINFSYFLSSERPFRGGVFSDSRSRSRSGGSDKSDKTGRSEGSHAGSDDCRTQSSSSFLHMNMSNLSYCSDEVMNKDFLSYMHQRQSGGSKQIVKPYIDNLSQGSQFNDFSSVNEKCQSDNFSNYETGSSLSISTNKYAKENLMRYNGGSLREDRKNRVASNFADSNFGEDYHGSSFVRNSDMLHYPFHYGSKRDASSLHNGQGLHGSHRSHNPRSNAAHHGYIKQNHPNTVEQRKYRYRNV